jgi:hypothetical protein
MITEAPSTARVKSLRERRSRGVAMAAPVAVGEGGLGHCQSKILAIFMIV